MLRGTDALQWYKWSTTTEALLGISACNGFVVLLRKHYKGISKRGLYTEMNNSSKGSSCRRPPPPPPPIFCAHGRLLDNVVPTDQVLVGTGPVSETEC